MSLKKFTESLTDLLPGDLAEDMKKNIKAVVQSTLEKMDLVTRDELAVQEKVLSRTRSEIDELKQKIIDMEKKLEKDSEEQ